jgi:hypothetical protein
MERYRRAWRCWKFKMTSHKSPFVSAGALQANDALITAAGRDGRHVVVGTNGQNDAHTLPSFFPLPMLRSAASWPRTETNDI